MKYMPKEEWNGRYTTETRKLSKVWPPSATLVKKLGPDGLLPWDAPCTPVVVNVYNIMDSHSKDYDSGYILHTVQGGTGIKEGGLERRNQ